MLEALIRGFFRKRCEVAMGGGPLTTMHYTRREGADFQLQGYPYAIGMPSSREYLLSGPQGVHASAVRDGRNYAITSGTGRLDVVKPELRSLQWQVLANGQPVGTIGKRGGFDRSVVAQLPPELPLPLQLFALHLVLMLLLKQDTAAGVALQTGT